MLYTTSYQLSANREESTKSRAFVTHHRMKLLFEFGRGSSAASRRNQNNVSSDETTHIGDPLLRSDFLSPPGISIHGSRDEVERERERELLMTQQSRRAAAAGLHGEAGNFNINARSKSSARDNRSSYKLKLIGNLLAITSCLSFLIAVPMITYHAMVFDKARPDFAAFYSAGAFVLITLIMSLKIIYNHFTHWYMPDVQKYVVRILWMVPIYATQSWLSLRFHNARIYIDTLRDLYEAYVIQSFLYFLMELLGGEDTLVQILQEKDSHYGIHLGFFKFFIKPWEMGYEFVSIIFSPIEAGTRLGCVCTHDCSIICSTSFALLSSFSLRVIFSSSLDGKLQIWRAAICRCKMHCIHCNRSLGTNRSFQRRRIQLGEGIHLPLIHHQLVTNVGALLFGEVLPCHSR